MTDAEIASPPNASVIEIRNRWNSSVVFATEAASMREAVLKATGAMADLSYADLSSADLSYANLSSANLSSADLSSANLSSADLSYADLSSANLSSANLSSADLSSADLSSANLSSANLSSADLSSANLSSARINWDSHALVSKILLDAAGENVGRRKIAGLILVSPDWCWNKWFSLRKSRHFAWAIDSLAPFVKEGDNAPDLLKHRAAELASKPADVA